MAIQLKLYNTNKDTIVNGVPAEVDTVAVKEREFERKKRSKLKS